jgi:hypothetical protein
MSLTIGEIVALLGTSFIIFALMNVDRLGRLFGGDDKPE